MTPDEAPIVNVTVQLSPGDPTCRHRWLTSLILFVRRCQKCGRVEEWHP